MELSMTFGDRGDWEHPLRQPDLDSSAAHWDPSCAIERSLLGKLEEVQFEPEGGQRHVVRLPENASELRV